MARTQTIIADDRSPQRQLRTGFLFVLLTLLCMLAPAHSYQQPELTTSELTWLKAHPVIRLAPDPEFRPIEYVDASGTYQGMAADHIRLLEKKLGIRITIEQFKDWSAVLQAFKAGKIDLLGAVVPTEKRSEFMLFSNPLFDVPGAIFVRNNTAASSSSLADLNGKRVAVVANYTAHDILRTKHPEILLDVVPDTSSGLSKLAFGMVDAFVENVATASYYLQEAALTNIRIAGTTDFHYRWAIGVRKDLPELQRIINKGLAAISIEERQAINNRWIPITPDGWTISPRTLLIFGILLACGIAVVTIIWNRSLTREIRERVKIEQELELINSTLERRVAQEVEQSRLKDRILFDQARFAAMGEMLHSIAHQWRQPLNNIAIFVQNLELEQKSEQLTPERLHQNIKTIMGVIRQMSSTIDDFKIFFRKEQREHPFAVADIIRKALLYMSARIEQNGITVISELQEDATLVGYASEYIQVLLNILANAVDTLVRNKTSLPVIRITMERLDNCVRVLISDNGGGIPDELLDHIFEPYVTTKSDTENAGISLFMACNIVEHSMHGLLTVTNTAVGAQFCITTYAYPDDAVTHAPEAT